MSRTYTLTFTLYGAQAYWINNDYGTSWSATSNCKVGGDGTGNMMYYVNMVCNGNSTYNACRSKTITSIILRLNRSSGSWPNVGAALESISYKANGSTSSWQRTGQAIQYIQRATSGGGTAATVDLSLGTSLPQYGYVFGPQGNTTNWQTIITNSATLTITTNETLTLAYNANGGSGAPSSQTLNGTPNATFTISSTQPTRSGYTFLGWSTSSTATTASYSPGGSITLSTSGTTTLYAVWKPANTVRIVNSSVNGFDTYLVYIVENNALVPYRVTIVNSSNNLDSYT